MKVFIIGGTGLLGSSAAWELTRRGHEVISMSLPPLPEGAVFPPSMKIIYGNYLNSTDEELRQILRKCSGFIFASGVDERLEGPPPVYKMYQKYNIDPVKRLLRLAKECGVRHSVVCGSYFSYFNRIMPQKDFANRNPYIRSRVEQEEVALSYACDDFDVSILELPYIFGTQPGRKPVWVFLAQYLLKMKPVVFYPDGGSAMVTVRQVGEALAGAIECSRGGQRFPIGWFNLKWKEMLNMMNSGLGCPNRKVVTIPRWLFSLAARRIMQEQKHRSIQSGLDMTHIADLQCSDLFIWKELGCTSLGVTEDNLETAIADSMKLCRDILVKNTPVMGMRGE